MQKQILKHTTQDSSGEPLYLVKTLCEMTRPFVYKGKNSYEHPDLLNYTQTIAGRVKASPDRIIHPNGKTARNELVVTIDNFCDALDSCKRYVVDSNEVYLFLSSVQIRQNGSTFTHFPSLGPAPDVIPFDNGPHPEVTSESWSLGNGNDTEEVLRALPKCTSLIDQILDVGVKAQELVNDCSADDTDESVAMKILDEVFGLIKMNMEVK